MSEISPETLPNYNIKWNGMILPINSELWDEWTLSKKLFDYPELLVPVRIVYVPDDEFDEENRRELEKPKKRRFWKFPKFWWQYYKTRAITYRGIIYVKQSAHNDRGLILHELGHAVPFLDHGHILRPGIMNPISILRLVNGNNRR